MENKNFMRSYVLKAGQAGKKGIEIGNTAEAAGEALHISFSVEKSNAENPNDGKVQIWDLSPESIRTLEGKNCYVELKAGYGSSTALILAGHISSVITTTDNADRLTELQVVDGLVALRDTWISISINGKVNCKTLYQKVAGMMGISVVFAKDLSFKTLPNGYSYVGRAKNVLQKIAAYCGHIWTIQNNVLQITRPGRPLASMGYLLSSETGLIGTPKKISIESGKEEKTGWEVEYLLNGAVGVNDVVELKSSSASGHFLVHKITIDGDNREGDWICTAQLLKIAS